MVGKSRSHLANTLRLLKLPPSVQAMLREGKITPGHARALVGREDAAQIAERIVDQQLTVRDVETALQNVGGHNRGSHAGARDRQVSAARRRDASRRARTPIPSPSRRTCRMRSASAVEVKPGSGESGYLSIRYSNFEQLDYVRNRLLGVYG